MEMANLCYAWMQMRPTRSAAATTADERRTKVRRLQRVASKVMGCRMTLRPGGASPSPTRDVEGPWRGCRGGGMFGGWLQKGKRAQCLAPAEEIEFVN